MDALKQMVEKHREEFDHLEPSASGWEHIAAALPKVEAPKQNRIRWYAVAASIAFLVVCASLVYFLKNTTGQQGLDLHQEFPNISLLNPEGKAVALDELEGKIVLVEFWASWSTVCTEENCYYFEPIYQDFRDKGFEVYAVSLDHDASAWKAGIERDALPWTNVSDLQGLDSELTRQFSINQLPATFLLDENGKIIARNLNATQLRAQLNDRLATIP